jgi:transposase-like protein
MAGLPSREIADAMEDHWGRKPSHSSALDWARALGSVGWTVPPRGRRPVAVGEAVEKVNGREVYVWAAMDVTPESSRPSGRRGPGAPWTRSSS